MTRKCSEILQHFKITDAPSQGTVKRCFIEHLKVQGTPIQCAAPCCPLKGATTWNGEDLVLILDHISGNRGDNTPGNLQLLCPNCASQLVTHAGGNRGRVEEITDSLYSYLDEMDRKNYRGMSKGGSYSIKINPCGFTTNAKEWREKERNAVWVPCENIAVGGVIRWTEPIWSPQQRRGIPHRIGHHTITAAVKNIAGATLLLQVMEVTRNLLESFTIPAINIGSDISREMSIIDDAEIACFDSI
jgi:hypothetical protein